MVGSMYSTAGTRWDGVQKLEVSDSSLCFLIIHLNQSIDKNNSAYILYNLVRVMSLEFSICQPAAVSINLFERKQTSAIDS